LGSLLLPWVNAETMSLFLAEVAQRHPDEFIGMVVDQAGWHLVDELTVPQLMRLVFLPPYSTASNPAQHLGDSLRKDCFASRVFVNPDAVDRALAGGLGCFEADPDRTRSMNGLRRITSESLNAIHHQMAPVRVRIGVFRRRRNSGSTRCAAS
jgi:hypothetical protein